MFTFNKNKNNPENTLKGDEFVPPPDPNTQSYTEYDPLKGLPGFYGRKLTVKIPKNVENLFEEEADRRPGITDDLTFYTGTSWAIGSVLGGMKGTLEGIKAVERADSLKIRVNRLLNSGGSVGRRVANRGACLGMLFGSLSWGARELGRGYIDEDLGFVLAGVGTGALFRVFGGVRGAAVGGAVGGVLAGAYLGGRELINKFAPDLGSKFERRF